MSDALNTQSESIDVTVAEPEPAAPAEEMVIVSDCQVYIILHKHHLGHRWLKCLIIGSYLTSSLSSIPLQDAAGEQACEDVLPEEPKPDVCDMPCQMQLVVESVEMSVESTLSGHVVPEVSIEG